MNILGMSYMYHDSSATLLRDGAVVAAAAEERFTRVKHTVDFPVRSIQWALAEGGIGVDDLDAIVFYEKPFLKFERILRSHLRMFPRSFKSFRAFLPMWMNYKLQVPQIIRETTGYRGKVYFTDHHYAHAASAFYPSPFDEALLLTTDGTGEWSTLAFGYGRGETIKLEKDLRFPHSLGLLYSSITAHLGFKVNGGEGKVMGLASYGQPVYLPVLMDMIDVREDGSFRMNLDYFSFHYDLVMTNARFVARLIPPREPESELRQEHYDLAASLQAFTEEVLVRIVRQLQARYGHDRLCMAGGVALNCVANGRILERTGVKEVWVQPAAGDDGGSLGAALYAYKKLLGGKVRWRMDHAYLGPSYTDAEIEAAIAGRGVVAERLGDAELVETTARHLADGRILAWFQGRMEYGPRALGNRSILTDPRPAHMKDTLNARVKHREHFRPFAPAVAAEASREYFQLDQESPYMLVAAPVRADKQAVVPAITHVDGTARVQTVSPTNNPRFYDLISAFGRRTGVPMLLNTSFNVRGEPIVCTPDDAIRCFLGTNIDVLVLGNYVIRKPEVPA
jgi:carbamoyltransferase